MNGGDRSDGGSRLTVFSRRKLIHSMAATGLMFAATPAFAKQNPDLKKKSCPDRKSPEKVGKGGAPKKPPIVIGKRADDIESFDPHESVSSSAAEIIGNLYETLVVWNPETRAVEPNRRLVSSCVPSADALSWTFVLEAGRKFASGNPITAEDVVFSLERLFKINGAEANILGPLGLVVGRDNSPFRVVDGKVNIVLPPGAHSRLLLPCLTASVCSVIDKRLLESNYAEDPLWSEAVATSRAVGATTTLHDSGRTWLKFNSAGSGPFKISEIVACNAPESAEDAKKGGPVPRNDEIVLQANKFYPGNSEQTRSIVVRSIPDPVEQKRQLDRQDVQVAWNLSFPYKTDDKSLTKEPAANLLLLCMNVEEEAGHLGSADVRQAIRCAISVQGLAEDLNSERWSAQHEFCPSVLCKSMGALAGDSLGTNSPFDPKAARTFLNQARIKNRIELTIDHIAGNPRSHVATLLANQLDALADKPGAAGFRIRLRPSTGQAFLNRLQQRKYQLALLSWNADYPDPHSNAYAFCANSEIENRNSASQDRTMAWYCRWFDRAIADDVKAAGAETNWEERRKKYKEIQVKLQAAGPFAFLLEEKRIVATRTNGPKIRIGMLDSFTRYPTQNN